MPRRLAESNGFSTLICLAGTSIQVCRTTWQQYCKTMQNSMSARRFSEDSLKLTQDKMDPMHCATLVNTWTAQTNSILLWSNAMSGVGWRLSIEWETCAMDQWMWCYLKPQKLHARSLRNAVHKKRTWDLLWFPCARLCWHLIASNYANLRNCKKKFSDSIHAQGFVHSLVANSVRPEKSWHV